MSIHIIITNKKQTLNKDRKCPVWGLLFPSIINLFDFTIVKNKLKKCRHNFNYDSNCHS